jgi:hypothetical protein
MNEGFLDLRKGQLQVVVSVVLGCMIILPLGYEMYVGLNMLIAASFGYIGFWEVKSKSSESDGGLYLTVFILLACWFLPVWEDRGKALWIVSDVVAIIALLKHRSKRVHGEG